MYIHVHVFYIHVRTYSSYIHVHIFYTCSYFCTWHDMTCTYSLYTCTCSIYMYMYMYMLILHSYTGHAYSITLHVLLLIGLFILLLIWQQQCQQQPVYNDVLHDLWITNNLLLQCIVVNGQHHYAKCVSIVHVHVF